MIDEAEKTIRLGEEADKLLKNRLLNGAITHIRNKQYQSIEESLGEEGAIRDDAYYMLRVIKEFEKFLVRVVKDGTAASNQIKNQQTISRIIR